MRWHLRFSIQRSGMSQRQLARVCGLSESRMSDIVRGWQEPRDDERTRIAQALRQPAEHLFDTDEAPKSPAANEEADLAVTTPGTQLDQRGA